METETFTAEEQAILTPGAPQPQPDPAPQAPEAAPEAPVQAVEPEKPVQAAPEPRPEPKQVPLAALAAEREKRQNLEAEVARIKALLEERERPPEQPIPAFEQDPAGHLKALAEKTGQTVQQLEHQQRQAQLLQAQQAAQQQMMQSYGAAMQEHAKTTPDLAEAYHFAVNKRVEFHQAAGYSLQDAQRLAQTEEFALVDKAFKEGINPGERIYGLAKVLGYAPKAQTPAPDNVTRLQAARQAANPISVGGQPASNLSVETIANMSEEDFARLSDRDFRRVMGG